MPPASGTASPAASPRAEEKPWGGAFEVGLDADHGFSSPRRLGDGEAVPLSGDGEAVPLGGCGPWREAPPSLATRGRLARSSVLTRNICPAPSASLVVMIGVWIQKKPFSSKKRCIAIEMACRTRATAPMVLVRGRRWATSRRYSNECCLAEMG